MKYEQTLTITQVGQITRALLLLGENEIHILAKEKNRYAVKTVHKRQKTSKADKEVHN